MTNYWILWLTIHSPLLCELLLAHCQYLHRFSIVRVGHPTQCFERFVPWKEFYNAASEVEGGIGERRLHLARSSGGRAFTIVGRQWAVNVSVKSIRVTLLTQLGLENPITFFFINSIFVFDRSWQYVDRFIAKSNSAMYELMSVRNSFNFSQRVWTNSLSEAETPVFIRVY